MRDKKLFVAILIPFVLLCLLIVRAEYHLSQGEEWKFEVTGYDPRDLLRGHYLRFNLAYDWENSRSSCDNPADCCLCLTDTGQIVPKVKRTSCSIAKTQCDGYMLSEFERSLNRYYIPEEQARQAEKILREARVDNQAFLSVAISAAGEPVISDMIINGESLMELLK
jgi:uncharacterized membrane-anchored protein